MAYRPFHNTLFALLAPVITVGCANMSVGESEFSCPGRPAGVRCASAVDIYRATEHSDRVSATSLQALGDKPLFDQDARYENRPAPGTGLARPIGSGGAYPLPKIEKPLPIRTPAQVMRVWIAPWDDKSGVLHIDGYHFTEIEARRWSIGEPHNSEPERFFPLPAATPRQETGKSAGQAGVPREPTAVKRTQRPANKNR